MGHDFDITIRALECQQCAAPISAPRAGGQAACGYCGTVNLVATRGVDAPAQPASMADEVVRLSQLKSQLEHPVTGHAYDLTRPPAGLGAHIAVEALEAVWREARSAENRASPAGQHKLCWVAMTLADRKLRAGEALASRVVLETSLDVLEDAGHRHLIRCRLATEAVSQGELDDAAGWLAECDPSTEVLELDSTFREAVAGVHVARRRWADALAVVGRTTRDIPIHPDHHTEVARMRVHCLESLGAAGEAAQCLRELCARDGERATLAGMDARGFAPASVAHIRTRRQREAAEDRRAEQRQRVDELAGRSERKYSMFRALGGALFSAPIWACVLLLAVTIPRMAMDFDPLLGVHGYAICPLACEGCDGPLRVVTHWTQTGASEWSSDGPQYFCSTRKNKVATMSAAELAAKRSSLARYELHIAPLMSSWLLLLLLASPLTLFWASLRHIPRARARRSVESELARLSAQLGAEVPAPPPSGCGSVLFRAAILGFLVLGALGAIAIELGWDRIVLP